MVQLVIRWPVKTLHEFVDHLALPLEKPADAAPGQMDGKHYPFLECQLCKLPFLDQIGCAAAIILYFFYHSHFSALDPLPLNTRAKIEFGPVNDHPKISTGDF